MGLFRRRRLSRSLRSDQRAAVEALKCARKALLDENVKSIPLDNGIELLTISHGSAAASSLVATALGRVEPLMSVFETARKECHDLGLTDDQLKVLVGYEFLP